MSQFLAEKRRELAARRDEIAPLAAEHARLEQAIVALDSVQTPAAAPTANGAGTPKPGKRPRKRGRPRATGAGRKKGSGKRAQEALALLMEFGPQTIQTLAERMKIKPNYLYRVLPGLESEGKVSRGAKGLYAAVVQ